MNYVNVTGSTKKKRSIAENAVIFCIDMLMPRMRTLDIELKFMNLKNEDAIGSCYEGETKRDFYIDIEKTLEGDELIEVVCHEMVHVWQAATRKMRDLDECRKLYKGKLYDDTIAYEDEPWEIEAYKMQGKLLKKFKKEYYV